MRSLCATGGACPQQAKEDLARRIRSWWSRRSIRPSGALHGVGSEGLPLHVAADDDHTELVAGTDLGIGLILADGLGDFTTQTIAVPGEPSTSERVLSSTTQRIDDPATGIIGMSKLPVLRRALQALVTAAKAAPKRGLGWRRRATLALRPVSHAADAEDRFVPTDELRAAYLRFDESLAPEAPSCVSVPGHDLELGIVTSQAPAIARAVSSMLTLSLDDARHDRGGHLPPAVVGRVQAEIISPAGVSGLWGSTGHRFVMSQSAGPGRRELVATILVARSKDTIFFLTGRYNNLRYATIAEDVDLEQPDAADPSQRWFDRFDLPPLARFKPRAYHHIANFVVARERRGRGYGRLLLDTMIRKYARDHLMASGAPIQHSQYLLCGRGFWQIGDPPWRHRMEQHGFYLRWGAESFFVERPWAPLSPVLQDGLPIDNLAYNRSYGLPDLYLAGVAPHPSEEHLLDRVPHVVRSASQPLRKLQYFQMMRDFL